MMNGCGAEEENTKLCGDSIIDLSSLDLTEVPQDILNHKDENVTTLYLDYNDFSGLPCELSLNWPSLKVLSANGNQITSLPTSVASLHSLHVLELIENELVSLPSAICDLKALETIRLTGNRLKCLPEKFSNLSRLRWVYLEENVLKSLPQKIGNLKNLTVLEASNNQLQNLPDDLGELTNLEVLNISNNHVTTLPDSFEHLSRLVHMDLSLNSIEYLPKKCGCTKTLQKFYAECNLLKALPNWVNHLSDIREFSVKDNHLTQKPLSESFGNTSKKLKLLDIAGNFISYLPESLGNVECLEEFYMGSVIDELERRNFQNGNWVAHLPHSFGRLSLLRELHLDENQLRELPSDFGNLSFLEIFDIGQNMLQAIPDSFCKLKRLRVCQFSRNSIKRLPDDFGDLESLEDLRLDNNQVCELPDSFSRLSNLKSLDLFNNRLTEIPPGVMKLDQLVRLDMGENNFEIPWHKVPLLTIQNRYASRNPDLKDNWRGKVRPDVQYDGCKEKNIVIEAIDGLEEEEGPEEAPYSSYAMKRAAERGLSFWRSHDGPQARPVYSPPSMNVSEDDGWISDTDAKDDVDSQSDNNVLNCDENDECDESSFDSDERHQTESYCDNGMKDFHTEERFKNKVLEVGEKISRSIENSCINHLKSRDKEGVQNCTESSSGNTCEDECKVKDNIREEEQESEPEDESNGADDSVDECDSENRKHTDSEDGYEEFETLRDFEVVDLVDPILSPSPEEDWDEEIENSLGPYDEIKVYHHPPRDHIVMCHDVRNHYFPAWDIHAKPVDWLGRMVEPQVEMGQFDDCEEDDS